MPKLALSLMMTTSLAAAALAKDALAQDALTGTFEGASGHAVSGGVEVTADSVELLADFSFDGAPDPKIGLGADGSFDPATIMAPLQADSGAQSYPIPEGIELSAYDEVYVWCEQYAVPLGVARLQ
jgi:hypothetical protein